MKIIKLNSIDQISQLELLAGEIWRQHYTSIIGTDQVEYMLNKFQSFEAITEQIDNGVHYYFLEDFGYLSFQEKGNDLFISKIYLRKDKRGAGYGKAALKFAIDYAASKKITRLFLTVNKENTNTIEAYKKLGFTISRPVVFDIGNGYVMDDYEMELHL